ncbi:Gfo/Idh/MocA family protein [Nocardiopsis changdeensis]|uniref:Gfo/Idh/MocA family oxidoreductase n=1 Tax=Nocardiopsis changdeensis TaxID=2831969 RepID=A0ABX8BJA0_9ACTN|nr:MULTISPECIES: Gfo/Idh/MocA family oxidoreductase [Nocardiopsis]QUX22324.1 Gfo/Idh/MocA family oxidoreductase [Nocardiopsis changdeensis]QYX38265.1 Gfo/Idh/MocA family oxidoreductase [Nocardiopsis sp. MT53]
MGLRFGLLGTGHWAAETQAAALAAHPGAELVGVWGRAPEKAEKVAARYGARAYADLDALLEDVDAVAVALPPDVQADVALRAARAGKHLLLDKPLALTTEAADAVVAEVEARGLASMVFFTNRFSDGIDAFVRESAERGGWQGVRATLFASIFRPGNPYGASPWRREKGGLWDVGPHVLSVVLPVLGPVEAVAAMAGPSDTVHLLTRHRGGAVGTFSVTLDAPEKAQGFEVVLFGEAGRAGVPNGDRSAVEAFQVAVDRLAAQVEGTPGDPLDVRFGREVVAVLEAAETALREGRTVDVPRAAG